MRAVWLDDHTFWFALLSRVIIFSAPCYSQKCPHSDDKLHSHCISYLLHNKLPKKLSCLKQQPTLISLTVPMGWEFRHVSSGHFWLRVSYKVAVQMLAGVVVTGRHAWGRRTCCQGDSLISWLLVGGLSSTPLWASPQGCLSVLPTWQLASHRARERRSKAVPGRSQPFMPQPQRPRSIPSAIFRSLEERH